MAKMKSDVVYLKDLVKRLDGSTLRDVAGLELKIQGWEWCDMEELVDLVVEHVTEDPLKALRYDLVLLPLELHEVYDEMVAGEAVEVSADDEFFEWYAEAFYLDLKQVGGRASKRYVCRMAEEVRAAVKANPDVYERLLELNEDLLLYVNSAAVLYGYVTYKEICDLYCRWNDDGLVDEQMVELVAEDGLEFEPEYLIHHGCICNIENVRGYDIDREVELFLKERADKPRWYPETEDEFQNWCDETTHLESESAKAFADFLKNHGFQNIKRRDELMLEIIARHQIGEEVGSIVSSVSERCKIKTRSEGVEYAALLGNFLNNIRLRTNNGWTPDELFANSSVQNANAPFVRTHPTVGRNAPCPCGSGKKYKKRCGKL